MSVQPALARFAAFAIPFSIFGLGLAQTIQPSAGRGESLDNAGASARVFAMGSAYVGLADDSSALFWNPAGLSGLTQPRLSIDHNSFLAGTFQETLAYGFPVEDLGGMAAAINYINWGSLDLRDAFGVYQGTSNDTDVGLSAGWGKEWPGSVSVGLSVQAIQQKVVDTLYTSLSGGAGLLWDPAKHWRFGLSYMGFGTPVGGEPLASSLQAGGSYRWNAGENKRLVLAFAGVWEPQGVSRLEWGAEGALDQTLMLRAG